MAARCSIPPRPSRPCSRRKPWPTGGSTCWAECSKPVLYELAADIGLAPTAFATAFDELTGETLHRHIVHSRHWLARAGGQGFPTFALETPAAQVTAIEAGRFLGRPDAWAAQLEQLIAQAA